jgi:S1-C subfamily serine protease
MDIEKLTKHQIVLLTLLVSFMTSIATGIVTVSLMNQAPPEVTRTINQIVEHTVEQVVPAAVTPAAVVKSQGATVVTKETTVVVKDDDLVAQSIATAQKSMVRLVSLNDPNTLLSRGIIISTKGVVLADRGSLEPTGTVNFQAIMPDGSRVPAVMRVPVGTSTVAILDLNLASSTESLTPLVLTDLSKLQLGQSVIRIGGVGGDTVSVGVVAKLPSSMVDAHKDLIEASVTSNTPGAVLLTLFGEAIGITTSDSSNTGTDFYTLVH